MDTRKFAVSLVSFGLLAGGAGVWALAQGAQPSTPSHAAKQNQPKGAVKEEDDEDVITLDKAPEPVRAAAVKVVGDAKNITKVIKEEHHHAVSYEVEYTEAGAKCSANFASTGELMETEKGIAEGKLPAAALEALKKAYPKATLTDPCAVTKMLFEVDVVIDGKKHEVKVDASGNIDNGSRHHDEHDKKHDGKKGEKEEDEEDDDDK